MDKQIFHHNSGPHKLSTILETINCLDQDPGKEIMVHDIKTLTEATDKDLSFLDNTKYVNDFKNCAAKVCLVPYGLVDESLHSTIKIEVKNPYLSYSKIIDLFYSPAKDYSSKIMPSAIIAKSAKIGKNCYIGHNVVIEGEVEIGDNAIIETGTFIDRGVKIGNNAKIYAGVSISYCIIGNDVVILPGAKIGQDGFGFATSEVGIHKKIYHIGRVIIGNDVEIGANSTIDRGSLNDTIIEDRCRIDNLVMIGHNAHIKMGSILVGQVGIAGSSTVGAYCALGGQVGVAGHLKIADKVQIASQSGIAKDILEPGSVVGGSPAMPIRDWHKQTIIMKKLVKERK
ncbi:MAG: UDP-3-O-(3-hydroxymyristoyl)glucosamine N-acyltransferase [Rickettsiaceae bacterium]|nr:UDP-3-O-(3-hydroxymyristoyl)glucosamine N-acyltransferase [Rickettsiaceae bacterium]